MAKPSYLNAKGIFNGDWNKLTGTGTKNDPLMYDGQKVSGTIRWNDGPANYTNGVLVTQTKGTTQAVTEEPAPATRPNQPVPQGPTGPGGLTSPTGTVSTTATADMTKKFGIIEALLFDPKYGKPNQKGGLWEVFDVDTNQKNPGKAADLWVNTDWYKLNDNAKERYLLSLEKQPVYQEQRNAWLIRIKKLLNAKNIKVDDATLFDYYDKGTEDTVIEDELITKQFPTGATGATTATGPVGSFGFDTRRQLAQVAKDNGLDLDKDFGGQINDWLQRIARGENIDNFVRIIRAKAGEGKSKYVQDQLALGKDLRSIYSRFITAAATAFNLDPNAIDINDPIFTQAFGDKGPIKFSEFEANLRKDPRFGATPGEATTKDIRTLISNRATALGITLTAAELEDIFNKLSVAGVDAISQTAIDAELNSRIAYKPGAALGGTLGNNLAELRATAKANGIDLDTAFGSSIQGWLQKLAQGESIETYKRIIRDAAKMGLPDNVKKLLDQGMDLEGIYAPYRSIMGSLLEIDPNSIDLNDSTLRSAIGQDKEMTLYDWKRFLRKDPRWPYTDNAREDVSNVALKVLRDFGFQG